MKICLKCEEEKPASQFNKKRRGSSDGLQSYCISCMISSNQAWKKQHPEKVQQIHRRYREGAGRKRVMLLAARQRAASKGFSFDITEEDFEIPEFCPILGVKLVMGTNQAEFNSATLDRIDPFLGYVTGNVQVISRRANMMKSDASAQELRRFAAWISKEFPDECPG